MHGLLRYKKSQIFGIMMVVITIMVLTSAFILLSEKYRRLGAEKGIGTAQFSLFNVYQKAENAQFYADRSSLYALELAVYLLAENGGYINNYPCGYVGSDENPIAVWTSPDRNCYPSASSIEKGFSDAFNKAIKKYVTSYAGEASLPSDYEIHLKQKDSKTTVLGSSSDKIVIGGNYFAGRSEGNEEDVRAAPSGNGKVWLLPDKPDLKVPVQNNPPANYRYFKANRGNRWHAGVDLYAPAGTRVVASEPGTVVNIKDHFYGSTKAIFVDTDNDYVINYAEVDPVANLKVGDRISAGQHIANIAVNPARRSTGSDMVHFEMYRKGTTHNINWYKGNPQPSALLDPTDYLRSLKTGSSGSQTPSQNTQGSVGVTPSAPASVGSGQSSQKPSGPPTFSREVMRITRYYTPHERDFSTWYGGYSTTGNGMYYCRIPLSRRGFYEDVKCEGSGITNDGFVCTYNRITSNRDVSKCLDPRKGEIGSNGVTASGTNPLPHRTIAVDRRLIPKGSTVFIYFGDNYVDWNGCYVAEDVGGGIRGNHIDLYVGVGKTAMDSTRYLPGMADVWLMSCEPSQRYTSGYADAQASERMEQESSRDEQIKYSLSHAFKTVLDYDLFKAFENYEKEASAAVKKFKECIKKKEINDCKEGFEVVEEPGRGTFLVFERRDNTFRPKYVDPRELVFRFAVSLADIIPPPIISNLRNIDASRSEQSANPVSVKLSWNALVVPDVDKYRIYCFVDSRPSSIENARFIESRDLERLVVNCNGNDFVIGKNYYFVVVGIDRNNNVLELIRDSSEAIAQNRQSFNMAEWSPVCCKKSGVASGINVFKLGNSVCESGFELVDSNQCSRQRLIDSLSFS